jgi:FHS family glucose/mannose:H+ symporter-like MFS transporter
VNPRHKLRLPASIAEFLTILHMQIAEQSVPVRKLTFAAYASFVPIGVATVLLGPMLPVLSARWGLNYSQAGALFTAQYIASTCAVAVSGVVVSWRGFRFTIQAGLFLVAVGLALMLAGTRVLGVLCISTYGAGLGISVPAGNLMVAEMNPDHRSATLNWLNFFWSAGAVACPFLVAAMTRTHQLPLFLGVVAGTALLVAIGIAGIPGTPVISTSAVPLSPKVSQVIERRFRPFVILAVLFLVYVGTENSFGGWVATFSKGLRALSPTMSLMTPSFFYASLMVGRWLAPLLLKSIGEITLIRVGLLLACAGSVGLIFSHELTQVVGSACVAGLGLSAVYPITISLLSKEFGAASSRVGSIMFVLSNIGGGLFPWIVGIVSNHSGTVKTGLLVPLVGCVVMLGLYLPWRTSTADTH